MQRKRSLVDVVGGHVVNLALVVLTFTVGRAMFFRQASTSPPTPDARKTTVVARPTTTPTDCAVVTASFLGQGVKAGTMAQLKGYYDGQNAMGHLGASANSPEANKTEQRLLQESLTYLTDQFRVNVGAPTFTAADEQACRQAADAKLATQFQKALQDASHLYGSNVPPWMRLKYNAILVAWETFADSHPGFPSPPEATLPKVGTPTLPHAAQPTPGPGKVAPGKGAPGTASPGGQSPNGPPVLPPNLTPVVGLG